MLEPIYKIVESNNTFYKLEKDLVPLINTNQKEVFSNEIDMKNIFIEKGIKSLKNYF